eukprot:gene18813-22410_t
MENTTIKEPVIKVHKPHAASHCCGHDHDAIAVHSDDDGHNHGDGEQQGWISHWPLLSALLILFIMLSLDYGFKIKFGDLTELIIFGIAYLLAGYNVLALAFRKAIRFDFFNEFFLMSVATIGAFAIGSYSEGVAVMVFYSIGEWFQDAAVNRAKRNIKALLDIRPDTVTVLREGKAINVKPAEVEIEEVIQVKPGEKVALDGILLSDKGVYNTAAMTGESKPDTKLKGEQVLAGMINLNTLTEIRVQSLFQDSKLIYTPIVFLLALMVVVLPYFFVQNYVFQDWFYRGLVFLVISCPCALVVSIPLGYFGGIGLASKNGILFKGSNFLDVMTKIDTVVMDKTGTLTKGVFNVQKVVTGSFDKQELIRLTAGLESKSTHPIAIAISQYAGNQTEGLKIENVEEVAGMGLKGKVEGKTVLAGNAGLLKKYDITYDPVAEQEEDTIVMVAVEGQYAGYFTIADEIKEDAGATIKALHELDIKTVMLSGDKQSVVDRVAKLLGMDQAFGGLLPEGKVEKVEGLKAKERRIAFVGDGVNDAPVVALADAGIAMGGLGSDATIETADIVIQNDQPMKIVTAIKIGKLTRSVVWQNIALAMGVKIIVLILGAGGVATLWEAVIADVGVALLAILNAVRIQRIKVS